jgi:hypothetical protein
LSIEKLKGVIEMAKIQKSNIIRSLIMKASEMYNTNENERASCLIKARNLSEKYNLVDLYIRMYEEFIKPQFEKSAKEKFRDSFRESCKKSKTSNCKKDDDFGNYDNYKYEAKKQEDEDFENFKAAFYENARGNLVLKVEYDDRYEYITISKQKNGKYCVMNPVNHVWNLFDLEHAYCTAWGIFINNKIDYCNNPFW